MNTKRVIYGICVLAVMTVIFLFSSQNYDNTMKTSDLIVKPIENVIKYNTGKSFETIEAEQSYFSKVEENLDVVVRKSAHMMLFAILAIFLYLWLKTFYIDYNALMLILVFCSIYAGIDEIHQHFVNKRNARFTDVCIDEFGAVISVVLVWLYVKVKNVWTEF